MKIIKKLMLVLLCLVGAVNVNAQEEVVVDLTADMFFNWNGYGADAMSTSKATVEYHVGEQIGTGAMVIGTSTVDYLIYADLTGYTKMVFEGTPDIALRVLMNRQESNAGPLVEKNPTIGKDGTVELNLTELEYVHLNAIKTGWAGTGTITSIKLVKPADPLAALKEALNETIASAKKQSPVAKTKMSYANLETALKAAEEALKAEDATAETLTAAKNKLQAAIDGLKLDINYSNLTKEDYNNPYGAYVLYESTGLPYGDSNVDMNNYADLSGYDQLIVTVADGTPRFCFNRTTAAGQDNDDESLSEMIDIPNKAWGTNRYQMVEGNVYTIDLKKIVEEKGKAYLHCIKGANWANVTVTGMYLYKEEMTVDDLTADMFFNWDGYGADATSTSQASVDVNYGKELGQGDVVIGTGGVLHLVYADLTGYTKMLFEGTSGTPLRVLLNRQENSTNGPLTEKNPTIGEDGTAELVLTALDYVHLNAIKINWGGKGAITSIRLVKPADPLGGQKEALKKAIAKAKQESPAGKTEDSYNALLAAIKAAEEALNDKGATEESLQAAIDALNAAIDGLEMDGDYSDLTAEMFKHYENFDAGEGTPTGCAYELGVSTGLPYGDGNVDWKNYADLSEYDQLIVTVSEGKPRFCFNRLTVDGQDDGSGNLIDIPGNANSTAAYQTVDGNVYTIDLAAITLDKGFARLHSIKGANWANVTVTSMILYKVSNPVEKFKKTLKKSLAIAKMQSPVAKTEESFSALADAIIDTEGLLEDENPALESLEEALRALNAAVEGLQLEKGYSNLTKDMFKAYASHQAADGTPTDCAYELNTSAGLSYGDADVNWLKFADLSEYDQLIVAVTDVNAVAPRFCFNRLTADGQDSDYEGLSEMIDIPGKDWGGSRYQSIEEHAFVIDLKRLVKEQGFAHLHCIKGANGGNLIVTGLYLYSSATTDELYPFKQALKNIIATGKAQTPTAKSEESYAALQEAIAAAEDALKADNATEESLTAATEAIKAAIDGLQLAEGYSNLTKDMFYNWNGYGPDASSTSQADYVDFTLGSPLAEGGVVSGTGTVDYLIYADLTGSKKMIFEGTPGTPLRILMNRQESNNGPLTEKNITIDDDGIAELDLSDMPYIHLNAIKIAWGGTGVVNSIYLYKDDVVTSIKSLKDDMQQSDIYYDLQGRRVANPANGLYIVNGKKVVVK